LLLGLRGLSVSEIVFDGVKALEKHVLPKFENKKCWVCDSCDWIVMNRIFEMREFHGMGFTVGGQVMPLVAVTCQTCGHVVVFNAIHVGVIGV
jgi:hypothetical protein